MCHTGITRMGTSDREILLLDLPLLEQFFTVLMFFVLFCFSSSEHEHSSTLSKLAKCFNHISYISFSRFIMSLIIESLLRIQNWSNFKTLAIKTRLNLPRDTVELLAIRHENITKGGSSASGSKGQFITNKAACDWLTISCHVLSLFPTSKHLFSTRTDISSHSFLVVLGSISRADKYM